MAGSVAQVLPLAVFPVGKRMRLVRVDGGRLLKRRLLALGLCVGGEAEMVQRRPGGIVIARGGNRVALGEGLAHKLFAEALD